MRSKSTFTFYPGNVTQKEANIQLCNAMD
uniref:Uncharacterized protein n=1 Tax=Arundo donax TaxID=35708 RepID=A0A0A8ZF56_ARUDO